MFTSLFSGDEDDSGLGGQRGAGYIKCRLQLIKTRQLAFINKTELDPFCHDNNVPGLLCVGRLICPLVNYASVCFNYKCQRGSQLMLFIIKHLC